MKLRLVSSILIAVGAVVRGLALPAGVGAQTGPAGAIVRPPAAGFVTGSISAGGLQTCGVKTNGTVLCWGDDQYGEVDGSPSTSTNSGSPAGSGTFVQVSAGYNHTCGIKTDGTALCWGDDYYGEVDGTPNTTPPYETTGSPPGGGTFTQLSAGQYHTCGIRTDGTTLCWGYNYEGEVNGTPNTTSPYETTDSPPGGGTFSQISAGADHTCGIKSDGSVLCWGNNHYGQVDGVPNSTPPYQATGAPPGGGTFNQVSADGQHTCGIKTDGTVLCWGDNRYGEVNGAPNPTYPYGTTGSPPRGGTFIQISAGDFHTAASRPTAAFSAGEAIRRVSLTLYPATRRPRAHRRASAP